LSTSNARHVSTRLTPQSEPIPGSRQVPNSAGGCAFAVDDWTRLNRFLILGAEGGSYYAGERTLTVQNAEAVRRCLETDGRHAVEHIVAVSEAGRAPKNDPAVFALAMAAGLGEPEVRATALAVLPRVCRTGTHLFQFVEAVAGFRGWGRALRRAVGAWYTEKGARELAYQLTKYQRRGKWSHRDLLRVCHLKPDGGPIGTALRWALGKAVAIDADGDAASPLAPIAACEAARRAATAVEVVRLIREYRLVRECVPTRWLSDPAVWEALLEDMPLGAMVRNLATMTRVGLFTADSGAAARISAALADRERLTRARLHPIALLSALRTYSAGRGIRGSGAWIPVQRVVDALDGAFYTAFGAVVPTGKRWLLALDVSGSMAGSLIAGVPGLTARDGAAAMALVTATIEPRHHVIGFTGQGFRVSGGGPSTFGAWAWLPNEGGGVEPLPIRPGQRLDDALRVTGGLPMGPTDCALPMLYALERKILVDVFVVYTDSETWYGAIHPVQALRRYREQTGIAAKLVVVGMVSNGFSIADPDDSGTMDVVGFDTSVPQVMSQFAADDGRGSLPFSGESPCDTE
jgi:60 kDa SS-A/Ro ribonucleoprotein